MLQKEVDIYEEPRIRAEDRFIKRLFFGSMIVAVFGGTALGVLAPINGDDKVLRRAKEASQRAGRPLPTPAQQRAASFQASVRLRLEKLLRKRTTETPLCTN